MGSVLGMFGETAIEAFCCWTRASVSNMCFVFSKTTASAAFKIQGVNKQKRTIFDFIRQEAGVTTMFPKKMAANGCKLLVLSADEDEGEK